MLQSLIKSLTVYTKYSQSVLEQQRFARLQKLYDVQKLYDARYATENGPFLPAY